MQGATELLNTTTASKTALGTTQPPIQ